ncbi:E3 ubiquitin-protein ligase RNF168 [Bombina bombina]|uniref:E3 ubiquitin-protein ligase RNF168 n=1 Tax=Bombina bombina TaxID=8345 RepID=UPI00235B2D75|nr:E3 ubiquitin-protein ligase RNF168 [Bombina bombina]
MTKVEKSAPLSWSECLCPICQEILLEPVTMLCNHTLCSPCFQMTVEKSSLSCPLCRKRVSSWARKHARANTLVNMALWERIQRQYPKECQRRVNGQDTEDLDDGFEARPVQLLCKPGEIRLEYEAEISKIERERLAQEEAERKASEEYIQKLLADEEEQQRRMEAKHRQMEEQLRRDEELARIISSDLVSIRFLSPKPRRDLEDLSSEPMNNNFLETGVSLVGDEEENEMPTLTPQSPFFSPHSPEQESNNTIGAPILTDCSALGSYHGSQTVGRTIGTNYKMGAYNLHTNENVVVEKMDSMIRDMSKGQENISTPSASSSHSHETQNVLGSPPRLHAVVVSKRKSKDCCLDSEEVLEDCSSEKKRRKLPILEDMEHSFHAGQLMELEQNLFEKRKQEEEDRLFALQLQRELDKEFNQVIRQKGSPDEYELRPKRGNNVKDYSACTPTKKSESKPIPFQVKGEESPDENKKPTPKPRIRSLRVLQQCKVSNVEGSSTERIKVLRPSNKQQTILDLFQKPSGN